MGSAIRAITFDFWDTLLVDGSDEPARARLGLPSKKAAREQLVRSALGEHQPVSPEAVHVAFRTAQSAARWVWTERQTSWSLLQRLEVVLRGLERTLEPEALTALVQKLEALELEVRPEVAPGAREMLRTLSGQYRLGLISDTAYGSGKLVRRILLDEGLLEGFNAFVFSDEVGYAKPHPSLFQAAAGILGVSTAEIAHVGDREPQDVAGAHGVGARAILTTVVVDRGSRSTRAERTCADYRTLEGLIRSLEAAADPA